MIARRLIALCLFLPLAAALAQAGPQPLHPMIAMLPKGLLNHPFTAVTLVSGGTPPYTAQIRGALPPGMGLSTAGILYGTPRAAGTFRFVLDITDSAGTPATLQLSYALQVETTHAPERNTLLGPTHS